MRGKDTVRSAGREMETEEGEEMSDFRSVIRAHLNRLSPRKADKLTLADGTTVDIPESWYNGIGFGDAGKER